MNNFGQSEASDSTSLITVEDTISKRLNRPSYLVNNYIFCFVKSTGHLLQLCYTLVSNLLCICILCFDGILTWGSLSKCQLALAVQLLSFRDHLTLVNNLSIDLVLKCKRNSVH